MTVTMTEPDRAAGSDSVAESEDRVDLLTNDFDRTTLISVRHQIEQHAERHGLSGLTLYRFVVAVNEVTTNAVRHGGGAGRLELWRMGDHLYCRVIDRGPGIPANHRRLDLPRPPRHAIAGRGLWLARHGSSSLTIDSDSRGTTVTLTHPTDEHCSSI
jgi:anti-sigma regulatory factor (Ser/Thr protein kinase)